MANLAPVVPIRTRQKGTPGGNTKGTRRRFGYLRKLPSGRWQASYIGPDGLRHNAPVTFDTKGDATTWLDIQSAAVTTHQWKPAEPEKITAPLFTAYAEEWLAGRELKPRTRSEYRRILTTLEDRLGGLELDQITPAVVRTWYRKLDPATPTARAHAYALLRTILGSAVDEELLAANPCRIRGASTTKRVHKIKPATPDELDQIAAAMPRRYGLMVHLAAWCALRYGELAELRRSDLHLTRDRAGNLTSGVISVQRAVTWPADGTLDDRGRATHPVVGSPKSDAGVRDVSIPPHLLPLVAEHLDTFAQAGRDGLLFPNAEGEHLHHGSLYRVFRTARKAAGRPDLRWHDLRHTGATMAAQAGATTRELMDRLGHSTAGVAMRYQHVAADRQAELARKLSEMAKG
ncbi:MAG TPA: tyrosine-type recombinase/integrase [Propionibacteriaceae bacterium]|nr:tyrosine-type recombinase/integrase [Propionibacteriaceae bacterium]